MITMINHTKMYMKKMLTLLFTCALIFTVAACDNTKQEGSILEGSLESILAEIYEYENLTADFKAYTIPGLVTTIVTDENEAYYLGKEGLDYEEAIASEHMFSSSAYSLVLVRTKEGADIAKIKKDIKDNINPQKWICVGVDPNNVIVDNIGDVVILIMSDSDAQNLHTAFKDLTPVNELS